MSEKRRSTRIINSNKQKQQRTSNRSQVRTNPHALPFGKRIQQVANDPPGPHWLIEDRGDNEERLFYGDVDLSFWMANSDDFKSRGSITPSDVPIDFSKEWESIMDTPHCEYHNDDDESSRGSIESIESTDSLIFIECSEDRNREKRDMAPRAEDMRLWCYESQIEDVPGHQLKLSSTSRLEFMAMKHKRAGGVASVKINISGGILGERIDFRYDEEGNPMPFYVDCAQGCM